MGDVFEDYWKLLDILELENYIIDFDAAGDFMVIATWRTLLTSNDFGKNWSRIEIQDSGIINKVAVDSRGRILLGLVSPSHLLLMKDSRKKWERIDIPESTSLISLLKFHPESPSLFYLGTDSILYEVKREGEEFIPIFRFSRGENIILKINSSHLYLGVGEELYLSEDRGASWDMVYNAMEIIKDIETDGNKIYLLEESSLLEIREGKRWVEILKIEGTAYDIGIAEGRLLIAERRDEFLVLKRENDEWKDISLGLIAWINLEEEEVRIGEYRDGYSFIHWGSFYNRGGYGFFEVFTYSETPLPP